MKIKETIVLRDLRSLQIGTHFGLPAARFLQADVVKASYLGFGARSRAWRSYRNSFPSEDL